MSGTKMINKNKKYNKEACVLMYALGYSYQDIATVYEKATKTPSHKSGVYKVLQNVNIQKYPKRVNPTKIKQKYMTLLQQEGVYFDLVELYQTKYTKPVKDTRFR